MYVTNLLGSHYCNRTPGRHTNNASEELNFLVQTSVIHSEIGRSKSGATLYFFTQDIVFSAYFKKIMIIPFFS